MDIEQFNALSAEDILKGKTAIVYAGGGSLGIGHIGALAEWESMGGYNNITHVCGSSVGSIVAAATAAKASVEFMKTTLFGLDLKQFEDNSPGLFRDLYRLVKKWGWNKGDAIRDWSEQLMVTLTGVHKITMKQLYDLNGIHLTITYWSHRFRKTMYADHIKEPNMVVSEAMHMSSSIPVYYQAVWRNVLKKNQQEVLDAVVDGGTMDNFPLHILHEQGVPSKNIMGFKLCSTEKMNEYNAEQDCEDYDFGLPDGIIDALISLVSAMREQAMRVHVSKLDWKLTVKIPVGTLKSTDFSMTDEQKNWLFANGKQAIRAYAEEVQERLVNGEEW